METKIKIKKLPQSTIELEVEIVPEVFEKFRKKAILELGREIEKPGFRKGKVPEKIVEQEIDSETVLTESARLAIESNYKKVIIEKKLEPISQPKIQILKLAPDNPFRFRATFSVLPEIELPAYKELASKIEKKRTLVKDSEIEETLKWLQKSSPSLKEVLRSAQKGDFVEITFSSPGIKNGEKQKDAFILGKGHLVPGFEDKLLAMNAGEEKKFFIDFPSDFINKDLAGKRVRFEVKMEAVKKTEERQIDDQFARSLGGFNDLEALKRNIRQRLKLEKEIAEAQRRKEEILSAIEKDSKFEIPQVLIEAEKQKRLQNLKQKALKELNLSFKEYLEKIRKTERELLDFFEKEAEKAVKRFLILREISKRERISVSEEEIKREVDDTLSRFSNLRNTLKNIDLDRLKRYTEERIKNEKVFQLLEGL